MSAYTWLATRNLWFGEEDCDACRKEIDSGAFYASQLNGAFRSVLVVFV